jgi:hypothetical protein
MRRYNSNMKRFARLILPLLFALPVALLPIAASAADCVTLSVPIIAGHNKVCGNAASGGVIVAYVILIVQFMVELVSAVIILMIVVAGIQYLTSAGDPGAIKSAKSRLTNAIVALILLMFMYAILNAVLPSGVLH